MNCYFKVLSFYLY